MGLVYWLPLINDVHNQGLEDVDITYTNLTWVNGKIGTAPKWSLSTSDTLYLRGATSRMCNMQYYSMCAWVKVVDSFNGHSQAIISSGHWNQADTLINFAIKKNGSSVKMLITASRGWDTGVDITDYFTFDEWHHVCMTWDGDKTNAYVDGVLCGSIQYGGMPSTYDVADVLIGGATYTTPTFRFNGLMNDIRIYDHCLSPLEVKEISKGLVLHYPLAMPGQENLVKQSNQFRVGSHAAKITPSVLADGTYQVIAESGNSNYTSSWWMTTDGIEDSFVEGETFTISFTIKSSDANTTTPPKIYIKSGMGYYPMKGKVTDAWSTVYYTGTWKKENSLAPHLGWAGLVGTYHIMNWKIERGSRPTPWLPNPADTKYAALGFNDGIEYDISGYNHNGTKYGVITYDADTPRYKTSAVFNGTNGFIEAEPLPIETKTISVWVKTPWASSSGYKIPVHDKTTGLAIGWSGNQLITYIGSGNGGAGSRIDTSGIWTANKWHHVVIVKTGDTTRNVYIDGLLISPVGEDLRIILNAIFFPNNLLIRLTRYNQSKP